MQSHQQPLSKEIVQQFREKGYAKIQGIASQEEIHSFKGKFTSSVMKIVNKEDKQKRIDDYSEIFTQVTNLWHLQPSTQQFILNHKFAEVAKQLLGVQHIRLYHDQALIKNPSAKKTPWHQDYFYWPMDTCKTVTMWIPLHNCPRHMGTMKFVKGSHERKDLKGMPISQQSEEYFQKYIKEQDLQIETFDLKVGDATFHYGKTLHCAHANTSDGQREVMTIIFMEDGAKVVLEQQMNEFRKVDLQVFCPGVKCSEIIASPMNPLLC